ncbi:MAG: hypothetical protein EP335_15620 [Alphaproteobacteria bacterium]|nr:MAG: hypothetical protein EP335_15620 [Alphaproteobacteria bacterium]
MKAGRTGLDLLVRLSFVVLLMVGAQGVQGADGAGTCAEGQTPDACIESLAAQLSAAKQEIDVRSQLMTQQDTQIKELQAQAASLEQAEWKAARSARRDYYLAIGAQNQALAKIWDHNVRLLTFQRKAADILLIVVVGICGCGILFSGYELYRAGNVMHSIEAAATRQKGVQPGHPAGGAPDAPPQAAIAAGPVAAPAAQPLHSITFSPEKIQFQSAATGITVLFLSLGFLYLFLQEVYSIEVTNFTDKNAAQQADGAGEGG